MSQYNFKVPANAEDLLAIGSCRVLEIDYVEWLWCCGGCLADRARLRLVDLNTAIFTRAAREREF